MITTRFIIFVVAPLSIALSVVAFAPTTDKPSSRAWSAASTSYVPMKRVGYASPPPSAFNCRNTGVCRMSTDAESEAAKLKQQAQKLREEAAEAAGVSVEELMASVKSGTGTVYDDESEVPKENLSSAMKERLMREASTGLDSNKSQTNVILYISAAIALLVLLGGQGILF
ncbi:hypothetical protein ACHAW6_012413 [Cyclotella cf. meneghiniana]